MKTKGSRTKGSRTVVTLGIVSLLTDLSTEMVVPVLPLFVTGVLGASVAAVGWIEGVAEATSYLLRTVTGWLSDRLATRKPFLLMGYGISATCKTALALANSWGAVLGLRTGDRFGKAIRNPAVEALIAASAPPGRLGRSFGAHRALDTFGAALGPLAAFVLLAAFPMDLRRVFLLSGVPAVSAVFVLLVFVRPSAAEKPPSEARRGRRGLGSALRRFLLVAGLFGIGNISVAFLLLRAKEIGFTVTQVPLIYLGYNLVYSLFSWPVGRLSDRLGRRPLILTAYLLYATVYALLAWRADRFTLVAALTTLGLHSAMLETTQRAWVAELAEARHRATAFGVYYAVIGLALLTANAVAGWLWEGFGPQVVFAASAALATAAAGAFVLMFPPRAPAASR